MDTCWDSENVNFHKTHRCLTALSFCGLYFNQQIIITLIMASQVVLVVKNPPAKAGDLIKRSRFKIPWRREWQPTPVFLPGESHRQRMLAGYSPWGCGVRYKWRDFACNENADIIMLELSNFRVNEGHLKLFPHGDCMDDHQSAPREEVTKRLRLSSPFLSTPSSNTSKTHELPAGRFSCLGKLN